MMEVQTCSKKNWNKNIVYPVNGKTYAITITLTPANQEGDFMRQAWTIRDVLIKQFKYMGSLNLYPELTQQANLHFHGYYTCTDSIKYTKTIKKRNTMLGFILLKEIDDQDKWFNYCNKEKADIEQFLVPKYLPSIPFTLEELKEEKTKKKLLKKEEKKIGKIGQIFELIKNGAV